MGWMAMELMDCLVTPGAPDAESASDAAKLQYNQVPAGEMPAPPTAKWRWRRRFRLCSMVLEHVRRRRNPLHPQIHLRLSAMVRRVGKVRPEPLEAGHLARCTR